MRSAWNVEGDVAVIQYLVIINKKLTVQRRQFFVYVVKSTPVLYIDVKLLCRFAEPADELADW